MITFFFNVENKHRGSDVTGQLDVLTKVKGNVDAVSASLHCPNHGADSRAAILLRGTGYRYEYEVLDSCCAEFREAVKRELASGAGESVARVVP